jgi:CheY-like chemotaxis protein
MKTGKRDLNEMVSEMIPLLNASLGGSIVLHTPLYEEALFVQIDASELHMAVLNLAIDARAAMQHTRERILTLSTRREDIASNAHTALAAGSYAVLEIGDTGSRLPQGSEQDPAEAPAPAAMTGEQTGRGFDIAQKSAEQCRGGLTVRHSPGQGTLVSLYLPIAKESSAHPGEPAETTISARNRALMVDDEEGLRTLAHDWMESIGFDVETASSADEALSLLAAREFDILFTDILMPGSMDGIALARLAKAEHPALQILLISGYARALLDTPNMPGAVLKKPYRKADLVAAIATAARAALAPA